MNVYCITNSPLASKIGETLRQRFEIPHVPMQSFIVSSTDDPKDKPADAIVIAIKDMNISNDEFDIEYSNANYKIDLEEIYNFVIKDETIKLHKFLSNNGLDDDNWKNKTGQTSLIDHILNIENVNWKCPCGQCN